MIAPATREREEPLYVPEAYDEALDSEGDPRPAYEEVIPALREANLEPINERIVSSSKSRRSGSRARREGLSSTSTRFRGFSPPPEWELLERGLRQRADALNDAVREEVLDRIEEMVLKPRALLGGEGIVIADSEQKGTVDKTMKTVRQCPEDFVAQPRVTLSTHPTYCDGELVPRQVDLRIFALGDAVAPAALSRVALKKGSLIVNSSQGGGAKDTWVLAESRS